MNRQAGKTGIICFGLMMAQSCVHKPEVTPVKADGNFPAAISDIIVSKCAVSGCHNAASYQNAAQLLLDTWEHTMNGSVYGAEVIAYSPKYSPLLYYCNTDPALGTVADNPGHPGSLVTKDEYLALSNWIASGAPDKNGNIPFAENAAARQKLYLTNQGCDLVAVIDAKSKLVMRYIKAGTDSVNIESPHGIEVSPDGMNAYVSLYNGKYLQKINTATDQVEGTAYLAPTALAGTGQWSVICLSPDGNSLMVSGYLANGYVVNVNTNTMQVNEDMSVDVNSGGTEKFVYPHGIASNATFDTFYTTLQFGNVVMKYTFKPTYSYQYISIDGNVPVTTNNSTTPDPHQVIMSPDGTKYFVTCQNTAEVRVMDVKTDKLIKVINVHTDPQEMTISGKKNQLFVSCMQAANAPGLVGVIDVIDIGTMSVVKTLQGDFYQPHGMAVDEQNDLLFIPSRNASAGIAPHHTTACGGNAGWYSVYDLNTLEPVNNKRYYVTVDPYTIATRFK